jgi:hypothetical protein
MNKRQFENYTNEELKQFAQRINGEGFLENDILFDICTQHFGSESLVHLMMLAVPLCLELSERLPNQ